MGWMASNGKAPSKMTHTRRASRMDLYNFKQKYRISNKVLGSGGFGKVFEASLIDDEERKVAIKVISKRKIQGDIDEIFEEIEVLKNLDHPNIINYIETYENKDFVYIVTELWEGGELYSYIHDKVKVEGHFNESEAAEIMKMLLKAIHHCHSYKIAHRDIKPENIMLNKEGHVSLIDFGLSKARGNKGLKSIVGSPYYVAPEVLQGKYGLECDIWSLGVILYILLCGYLPFSADTIPDIFEKIQKGEYSMKQKEWKKVSLEAKDLVKGMLELNVKKRLSAEQCLAHSWFEEAERFKGDTDKDALDIDILENLKEFKSTSMLKKTALSVLVKMVTAKEITSLKKMFETIDTDHTGFIDAQELSEAMKKSNLHVPAKEIDKIIGEIDYKGNKQINYSEFIAATLQTKKTLNDSRLKVLFKEFDVDDSGYITKENMVEAFEKFDKKITKVEINQILKQHDKAQDGRISYLEFKIMMIGEDDVVDTLSEF